LQVKNNKIEIRTCESSSTILPEYVGETFHIYNGRKFVPVFIKKEMVGYKLGSFISTRSTSKLLSFIFSVIFKWVKKYILLVIGQVIA